MTQPRTTRLSLVMKQGGVSTFFPLLQQGFMVKIRAGCSIRGMLCDQFRVTADYVAGRIKTIFLNGKPVDDMDAALVRDGDTLALSAAMPGLVGATFRCGGPLIAFRSGITHREDGDRQSTETGLVRLKLFNLLVSEMGPAFLRFGTWFDGRRFKEFVSGISGDFWSDLIAVRKDGQDVPADALREMDPAGDVHLTVETSDDQPLEACHDGRLQSGDH